MGTVFAAQTKAAEAPNIEAGMYDLRFDGTEGKIVKGGQYQKDPNGDKKLAWKFTVLDDEGAVLFDAGEPVELEKLTGVGFNIAAKTTPAELLILKALLTPAEYAAFEGGEGTKEEDLVGRTVQGEVFVKDNGWPAIGTIIAARKKRTSK